MVWLNFKQDRIIPVLSAATVVIMGLGSYNKVHFLVFKFSFLFPDSSQTALDTLLRQLRQEILTSIFVLKNSIFLHWFDKMSLSCQSVTGMGFLDDQKQYDNNLIACLLIAGSWKKRKYVSLFCVSHCSSWEMGSVSCLLLMLLHWITLPFWLSKLYKINLFYEYYLM